MCVCVGLFFQGASVSGGLVCLGHLCNTEDAQVSPMAAYMSLDGVLTQWHSSKQGNEVVIVNFSLGNMYFICGLGGLFSRYTKSKGLYKSYVYLIFLQHSLSIFIKTNSSEYCVCSSWSGDTLQ